MPLSFEINQGQSDEQVKFLARGHGYSLFLTAGEAVLSLRVPASTRAAVDGDANSTRPEGATAARAAVVRMRLAGANTHTPVTGLDEQPGKSNYFIGDDPSQWHRDVPHYARVKYTGVYPGVDLIYYGSQRQLEYDLVVSPGADPASIALAFDGVEALALDTGGNLVLRTAGGDITQHKPVIYQTLGGTRQTVDGHYVLRASHRVGFEVARYDTARPLVIDPVMSYSTYLGGNGNDIGYAIAVDAAGSAYVTGITRSTNFPGVGPTSIQPGEAGSDDVFVTKFTPAGTGLVYSTYLGGSGGETGYAIAVDSSGNAYVTGETDSPTGIIGQTPFPLAGAIDVSYNGGGDAFITKINASGNALVYSTYLGGSGTERGYGIAVDSSSNAYVTGQTSSGLSSTIPSSGDFPTVAAFQPLTGSPGGSDAFVTKINAAGNALVYSTYLGGNASDHSLDGGAIALDPDGNAYVAGTTRSTNFPGAGTSPIQSTLNRGAATGRSDGFVVKFNAAGSALLYSTYLGGDTDDAVNGIAIDAGRNAYVVGYTDSANFPTAAALFATKSGASNGEDAFVAKINAAGTALLYSTFLGGSNGERAYAVAVDSHGNALVSGFTTSSDFPKVTPVQAVGGNGDAFITEFNVAGSALLHSTYLGGTNGIEHGYGIAVNTLHSDDVYVTGDTNSTNLPTATPFQGTLTALGGTDAFVTKIVNVPAIPVSVTATATSPTSVTITWTGSTGAASYQLLRHGGTGLDFFAPTVGQSYVDNFVVAGTAYLYRVRSVDGVSGETSFYSDPDLATTIIFTDDPLTTGITPVKAIHITELRTAVDAARVLAGLAPFAFTDGSLVAATTPIKKVHIEELRSALSEARTFLVLPALTFTDPVLTANVTAIKAVHVQQLRSGVK